MSVLQALVLGLIQGLTEFIPVSSSGHLVVIPELFGWFEQPLVFDTTMHLATAAALIVFFNKDIFRIVLGFLKDLHFHGINLKKYSSDGKTAVYILIGIIPAGLLGFLFEDVFENVFRGMTSVAVFLILGSVLMFAAEKVSKKPSSLNNIKALFVGIFQSLALFPGMSRSGSTISGAMMLGLSREEAARFSFLLSIPIILAAGVYQLFSSPGELTADLAFPLLIGFTASFLSGLWAIQFLLNFLKKNSLTLFIIYRLVLAGFLLLFATLR